MTDAKKMKSWRRYAEQLRTEQHGHADWRWWENSTETPDEAADFVDAMADYLEFGKADKDEEEDEDPEKLMAEAEMARRMADLLKRHDASVRRTRSKSR